ncbi:class I SAM-dependent methyltransferase [Sulfitobacter aestuarii]|uniref:Class I SAM-dependent methyltransferase n=1 Tax=Sulfitobacter aestuarii TaxID=2161676 RepID=A0ABW5U2Z1_9RHOB
MSLLALIRARIAAQGPMRLDEYMQTCLLHPEYGYYTTRDPFGKTGDFTTAPEISQMFGELLGLCLAQNWLAQGAPESFTLAELGPGRGSLMADALRACRAVPGFLEAADILLVEASPALRDRQRQTLSGHRVRWASDLTALPDAPLFLIANEFFDALPIRQFLRAETGWHERQVGLVGDGLRFGLGPVLPQPALTASRDDAAPGDLVETCDAATPVIDRIARLIGAFGGAALIVDYGDWLSLGDTFQALRDHAPADPLAEPGSADLTAHVDFAALAAAAGTACAVTRLTPQGVFLERLGITGRAQTLARHLHGEPLAAHIAAHRRLTHPEEMGSLFKVMGLYPRQAAPPPGLEA